MALGMRKHDSATAGEGPRASVPQATRFQRPGWRDPRLLVGLALVAGCVLAGGRLLASADDTVQVWAAGHDLAAGTPVQAGDLVRTRVHFADEEAASAYLAASSPPGEDARLTRAVAAGELLPRAALARGQASDLVEVPLSVRTDDLPATVQRGSIVDVWVSPPTGTEGAGRAVRVLQAVAVVGLPRPEDALAPQQTRQVIVGVPQERAEAVADTLGRSATGRVVLTREPGA